MSPFLIINALKRENPKTVLDVGTRTGWVAEDFANDGAVVTAIDPELMPETADIKAVEFLEATLETFEPPYPYDLVIANLISHLVPFSTLDYLLKLKSLIAPEGLIYVTLLGDKDDWSDKPKARVTDFDAALRLIDEAGLEPVYRSVSWHDGKTYDEAAKFWHLYTFVLHVKP